MYIPLLVFLVRSCFSKYSKQLSSVLRSSAHSIYDFGGASMNEEPFMWLTSTISYHGGVYSSGVIAEVTLRFTRNLPGYDIKRRGVQNLVGSSKGWYACKSGSPLFRDSSVCERMLSSSTATIALQVPRFLRSSISNLRHWERSKYGREVNETIDE